MKNDIIHTNKPLEENLMFIRLLERIKKLGR